VRGILEDADECRPSGVPGRFVVSGRFEGGRWSVVVEPDETTVRLIVVTVYRVE